MSAITHLKNRTKKLSKESFDALKGKRHSIVYLDDAGNNIGFDIDICRAVAAAVLGDADAIEIVPIPASDRGPVVQSGEVDLLTRNVTWTSGRDASWGRVGASCRRRSRTRTRHPR